MNWFERHLNWTWVLGQWIPPIVVGIILGFIAALAGFHTSDAAVIIPIIIFAILDLIFIILLTLWVLRRKNRSWWWFFILLVPFYIGWIIFLCLENRSYLLKDQSHIEPPKIPRGKVTTIDF
jgi:Ca2+/Na+ antiporter